MGMKQGSFVPRMSEISNGAYKGRSLLWAYAALIT